MILWTLTVYLLSVADGNIPGDDRETEGQFNCVYYLDLIIRYIKFITIKT